jgi:hypothetical protein
MIVRHEGSSQILISQPDHAALAGEIMRGWLANGLPDSPRRAEILLAVDQHDNGWREPDSAPIVDAATGAVLDFVSAPDPVRRGVWPRGVHRLAGRPYAAALVAQHAIHVYARYRAIHDWRPFFTKMEAVRDLYLHRAPAVSFHELVEDYFFVRIGDLISLTFCCGWTAEQVDPSGYLVRLDGSHLTVTPDPFAGRLAAVAVSGRRLGDAKFASLAEAREAFSSAPTSRLTGTVSGSPGGSNTRY